jgi:hypothetical protein
LANYSFQGVPDIRIVVFQGYPVMAMLRLAARASDGKANLHQGVVGVGLDIATGRGLRPRLQKVEALRRPHYSPEKRVTYAMKEFGYL